MAIEANPTVSFPELQQPATRRDVLTRLWRAYQAGYGYCTGKFPDMLDQDKSVHSTTRRVVHKFCADFWNTLLGDKPNVRQAHEWFSKLIDHYIWYRKELFCQDSRRVASPGGLIGAFQDLPALKNLRRVALSLCENLRSGTKTLDEV